MKRRGTVDGNMEYAPDPDSLTAPSPPSVGNRKFEIFAGLVDLIPQFLAWLEMGNKFGCEFDSIAGLGITPGPWWTVMQGETPEPPDFDPLPGGKGHGHMIDHSLYRRLDILESDMVIFFRQQVDQF